MDGRLAKLLAQGVVHMHNTGGVASLLLSGKNAVAVAKESGMEVVNVTPEGKLGAAKGNKLKIRDVTGYLWQHRKWRAIARANMVIWTAYSKEYDHSYIGMGALVRAKVAERLKGNRMGVS
jgi:hypothetical protein